MESLGEKQAKRCLTEFSGVWAYNPKEEAAGRHRERNRRQMDRAAYLETVKETAEQRRAQARLLRAKGLTWAEVGREMGISATAARLMANR